MKKTKIAVLKTSSITEINIKEEETDYTKKSLDELKYIIMFHKLTLEQKHKIRSIIKEKEKIN